MNFRFALILSIWAVFCAAQGRAIAEETAPESQPMVSMDLELCLTNDGPLTVADLVPYLKARGNVFQSQDSDEMQIHHPPSALAAGARTYLYERELALRVREEHPELPHSIQAAIDHYVHIAVSELLAAAAQERVENVTDEDARRYYDDNTILFRARLKFSMRHLFWSAYVPYVVKPGQTLQGIAQEVSGDPGKVTGIVTNEEWKVLRWIPPEERGKRPFRDAIPGEKLLVPMSEAMRAEAREMFGQLLAKLDEGVDFETLCREFTEAEDKGKIIKNLPFGNYPTQPEILKAGRTLPVGEVSGIIETAHGFEAIQIVERTDEKQTEFSEAKESIRKNLRKKRLATELERMKRESLALLEIDVQALIDPKASQDRKAVSLADRHWTVGQVFGFPGARDNLISVETEEQIRDGLSAHQPILSAAREQYARQNGLLEDGDFLQKRKLNETGIIAQEAIKMEQDKAAASITEEDLLNWYDENKEIFSPPRRFVVRQIVKGLDPGADLSDPQQRVAAENKAIEALRIGLTGVRSTDDFAAAAKTLSDDAQSAAKEGLVGQVSAIYKPGTFGDVMNSLEAQTVSAPFIYRNLAYAIWIDEIVSPPPPPFEKVMFAVRQRLEAERRNEVARTMIEGALEAIGYAPNPELQ